MEPINNTTPETLVTDSEGKILSFNNIDEAKKYSRFFCPNLLIEEWTEFLIQFDPLIEWINGESHQIPEFQQLNYVWNHLYAAIMFTYDKYDKEILDLLDKHRTAFDEFVKICLSDSEDEQNSLKLSKEVLDALKELIAAAIKCFDEHTKIIWSWAIITD
ncbi:hypothetical protein PN36_35120 [Candidatus Thiomargarita nelsonii]|uniref:Uncharacterized protein n=1 Tax=Candidatus Thiomargarita nelsonii TaxID=1003181 RepID=A0A4E0QWD4_9GAMM|nr:hypothetical protein PN36_35120 [Candidatus Thiomargarita nelsonii]